MSGPLLTVPKESKKYSPRFITGNEYLSFPEILPQTGALQSLNVLHMSACGLLEFCGSKEKPLVEPFLRVNGRERMLQGKLRWFYRHHWEPGFTMNRKQWSLQGKIFAPPGHRGGIYRLTFKNKGDRSVDVELGWRGCWGSVKRTVFTRKPLGEKRRVFFDNWTGSLILEAGSALPLAALALSSSKGDEWRCSPCASKGRFFYSSASSFRVAPGENCSLALFMAVNLDGDGAGTTLVDLRRRTWPELELENSRWLAEHLLSTGSAVFNGIMNRNLFFNYFYALGRTLDTDQLVAVTSRSPRYYVSAAFWSRDALLWSFPGILLVDSSAAREMLLMVFEKHLNRAGEHAHYLNGTLLYPGFELDQLCAYFLALQRYLKTSSDFSMMQEESIQKGLVILAGKLLSWRDAETGLYATFLDPSDDPVEFPFLIYNNALAWCALQFLASLQKKEFPQGEESPLLLEAVEADFKELADQLRRAIYKHGVVQGAFGPMFAWSVDGRGGFQLYDNPPGSLQLLSYYGFCDKEDEVYRNTVQWIRSGHNPYFHLRGALREAGSLHAGNPWPLAAANDLLAQNRGAKSFFSRVKMDNGFACETVHPTKGHASTGLAFASAAGFLAHAIWWRFKGEGRDGP